MDGTHFSPKSKNGSKRYLTSKNIRNSGIDLSDCNYISDEEHQEIFKKCPVKIGDILLTKDGANTGNCCVNSLQEEFSLLSSVAVLDGKADSVNNIFLLQVLQSQWGINEINNAMAGQAISRITLEKINKFSFNFPILPEQTKIANFLTAVDEKISQLTQKYDFLAQYKKGVMQQIFSQKLRFKDEDGGEFPEWKETILGKVADPAVRWSLTGGPFGSNLKAEDYTDNGIRIIQLQNIGDGTFNDGYKIYTSENKADELLSCNIYPNEIIISKMGDPVARCCIMPSSHDRYLMASDGIRLVVNRSLFNTKYIHDFINYETFRKNALEASTGSTRRRIGLDELKKLPVIYPCLAEQTKIANFLTAIDDKITQAQAQLEAVKQYKKGLLQQMFV